MLKPVRAPTETNEIDSTMALNSVNFIIMIKPAAIIPITQLSIMSPFGTINQMRSAVQKFGFAFVRSPKRVFVSSKIKYCPRPILEGQHGVVPPGMVPAHIIRPDYVGNPNPLFGLYEGEPVKHNQEMIDKLRRAAQLAARTLSHTASLVKAGMTTNDVDRIVHDFIIANDAYPTPIGFMGFPKSVCTSVNEVVCHGIPNLRALENGDYMNIDVTLYKDGVHGDSSVMVRIGDVHPDVANLIDGTQKALYESIKVCKPGTPFNEIGNVCEKVASDNNLVVCELFTGHGIGRLLHLPPTIMHHCNSNSTFTDNDYKGLMEPGNVFTIEPIFLIKHGEYMMWSDNFTVVSPDNPSAQWEHTILITETGCEVLTKRENEQF